MSTDRPQIIYRTLRKSRGSDSFVAMDALSVRRVVKLPACSFGLAAEVAVVTI